ncbi:MAG: RpiB/LacA/LacB family sugar-phosphate isomerase [bacterium]
MAFRMVFLGADHNGMRLKAHCAAFFLRQRIPFRDLTQKRIAGDDYPKVAIRVVKHVRAHRGSTGVLFCGSGNGMAMAANRFSDIRAAVAGAPAYARKARQDENANVLVIPAWWTTKAQANATLRTWLATKRRTAVRHKRRIQQLSSIAHG